jgi:nicotinate-nucleotide adenylyltransferase
MIGPENKSALGKKRIGLFGGTFNPIHSGHLKAAAVVFRTCALDEILFIPSFFPPHKESESVVSAEHRLRMVKLAVEGNSNFFVSDIEIKDRGKSYSILTLNKLRRIYPHALFFFILGIDAFLDIETWKDYRRVLDLCSFVVISRPGYHLSEAGKVLGKKYRDRIQELQKTNTIGGAQNDCHKIFILPFEALDVSSTEIRERLKKGLSIKGKVPPSVNEYIMRNKLYQ